MIEIARFEIPGDPVPKGRPRFSMAGKPRTYTPRRTREYEEAVGWAYRSARSGGPHGGPVVLRIAIRERPGRRGDIDNYAKAILDGLNGIAWIDDDQVVGLTVAVARGAEEPGATVTIWRAA